MADFYLYEYVNHEDAYYWCDEPPIVMAENLGYFYNKDDRRWYISRAYAHTKSHADAYVTCGIDVHFVPAAKVVSLMDLDAQITVDPTEYRRSTGVESLDKVLGGGAVVGSITLVIGVPGTGKSTLIERVCVLMAKRYRVLYITTEESMQQAALRIKRICPEGFDEVQRTNLDILATQNVWIIRDRMRNVDRRYEVIVIDSIQGCIDREVGMSAGTPKQVERIRDILVDHTKRINPNTCVFAIGHVIKDGSTAGPESLKHAVDVVIRVGEDNEGSPTRIISCEGKNRYGNTSTTARMVMTEFGLIEISEEQASE